MTGNVGPAGRPSRRPRQERRRLARQQPIVERLGVEVPPPFGTVQRQPQSLGG